MCLAHVEPPELDRALSAVEPGSDIDLRGTTITSDLLRVLLEALTPNEEKAHPILGNAMFESARFREDASFSLAQFRGMTQFDKARFNKGAWFNGAQFDEHAFFGHVRFNDGAWFDKAHFGKDVAFIGAEFEGAGSFDGTEFDGDAWFNSAKFIGDARFSRINQLSAAKFSSDAWFNRVQFCGDVRFSKVRFTETVGFVETQFTGTADFGEAQFAGVASFEQAQFAGVASFEQAQFSETASFGETQFNANAWFGGTHFIEDAWLNGARFEGLWIGPLVCRGWFSATNITVTRPVRLQLAAASMRLQGARFMAPTVLSVRYSEVDLTDVIADAPVTIASHLSPFATVRGQPVDDSHLPSAPRARVTSLAGVDAANLVLTDVDLSGCTFSGAHHLDQIRLEGRCLFASAPRGWQQGRTRISVRRWTRRKVLAEEVAWRADPRRGTLARAGWSIPGDREQPVPAPSPAQLAVLYRQLRKALEDGKDTPGAADFYYGEMEARRHDVDGSPRGERALLHAYWLLSGYALRASRALGFLAAAATATFLLMMTIGLPDNQLNPQITGTQPAPGGHVALTQSAPDPALTLPLARRFTADRANKAGLVVVNSVIFRSTGATLTGPGTWIEIISRIGEPILLGFAAVAARGRVQR